MVAAAPAEVPVVLLRKEVNGANAELRHRRITVFPPSHDLHGCGTVGSWLCQGLTIQSKPQASIHKHDNRVAIT